MTEDEPITITIPESLDGVREMFRREHERAVRAGAVTRRDGSRSRPRRKRGLEPYCAMDGCTNGVFGLAGTAHEDEFPTWLIGRRKDAAFCSPKCRQAAYRQRQREEREEIRKLLPEWRPIVVQFFPEADAVPDSNWKTWGKLIDIIAEAVVKHQQEPDDANASADREGE